MLRSVWRTIMSPYLNSTCHFAGIIRKHYLITYLPTNLPTNLSCDISDSRESSDKKNHLSLNNVLNKKLHNKTFLTK